MENHTDNFIKMMLKILDFLGGIQQKRLSIKRKLSYLAYYVFLTCYFFLACKNYYYLNSSLEKFAETTESSLTCFMLLVRFLINHFNKQEVQFIVSERSRYLNQNVYPELKKVIECYQRTFLYFYRGYAVMGILTAILLIFKIFTGTFIYAIWTPDVGKVGFYIIAFCQLIIIMPGSINIVGTDLVLIALNTELMIQLRILSNQMRNLNFDQAETKEDELMCNRKLKKCVKYHIFLLRMLRRVQKIFSPILLFQPIVLCFSMCLEAYIITECLGNLRFLHLLLKSTLYAITGLIEFALYCVSTDFVAFESFNVGEALYDSNWHGKYVKTAAQSIPFIIMRSNMEIKFTAGGLFSVKLRTILQVLKFTYSIFALLRTFKDHSEAI